MRSVPSFWKLAPGTLAAAALLVSMAAIASPVIYDNGALSGNNGSTGISEGVEISSAFTLQQAATATAAVFGLWMPSGVTPTTVDWKVGTSFFDGSIASGSNISSALFQTGIFNGRYDLYEVTLDFADVDLSAGTYYLSLSTNLAVRAAWDIASFGGGTARLRGPDFPEESYNASYAFRIVGADGVNGVPEPGALALSSLALLGMTGSIWLRRARAIA